MFARLMGLRFYMVNSSLRSKYYMILWWDTNLECMSVYYQNLQIKKRSIWNMMLLKWFQQWKTCQNIQQLTKCTPGCHPNVITNHSSYGTLGSRTSCPDVLLSWRARPGAALEREPVRSRTDCAATLTRNRLRLVGHALRRPDLPLAVFLHPSRGPPYAAHIKHNS